MQKTVTQDQISRYARASGDTNPIHLDSEAAERGPFGRVVAHGMLVLAFVSEMLTQAFGVHWMEGGSLKARFRAPVYPGDRVATHGAITRVTIEAGRMYLQCRVGCRKAGAEDVITGEAWLTVPEESVIRLKRREELKEGTRT